MMLPDIRILEVYTSTREQEFFDGGMAGLEIFHHVENGSNIFACIKPNIFEGITDRNMGTLLFSIDADQGNQFI